MKKINWSIIFSILLVTLLMLVGCYLIDNTWCYELEMTIVWSIGMICITEIILANKFISYLKNRDK